MSSTMSWKVLDVYWTSRESLEDAPRYSLAISGIGSTPMSEMERCGGQLGVRKWWPNFMWRSTRSKSEQTWSSCSKPVRQPSSMRMCRVTARFPFAIK